MVTVPRSFIGLHIVFVCVCGFGEIYVFGCGMRENVDERGDDNVVRVEN